MTAPEPSKIFRESALSLFERPEHEESLRVFGALLWSLIFEGSGVVDSDTPTDDLWLHAAGAIGDVKQAAEALGDTRWRLDDGGGGTEGARLLIALADAAAEVEAIAARLDAAAARYLAAEEAS